MAEGDVLTGYYLSEDDRAPVWHEYENEEFAAQRRSGFIEAQRYQKALETPKGLEEVQDAICELGDLADQNGTNVDEIMDAITELGNLVAQLMEVK